MEVESIPYAATRKAAWWTMHRRMVRWVIVSSVAAFLVWCFGPRFWTPIRIAYLQQRALAYTAPGNYCVYRAVTEPPSPGSGYGYQFEWHTPDPWFRYLHSAGIQTGPLSFVGRLLTPGEHDRVVVVECLGTVNASGATGRPQVQQIFGIDARVLSPGTLITPPKLFPRYASGPGIALAQSQTLRIFAGHADLMDRSHFTIVYQVDNQQGNIDGWLQDDDTVKLQFRDGLSPHFLTTQKK